MQLDFLKIKTKLNPLVAQIKKGWIHWIHLLPSLPNLSWSFFIFENNHWVVFEPHLLDPFKKLQDVKQLDKTGVWVRVLPWKSTFHQDLKLQFFEPSKRRELIPFQIEPLLPFSLDAAQLSHCALEKDSVVWVCAVLRSDLAQIEEENLREGLELDAFVSPLFALFKAHQSLFEAVKEPILYAQKEEDRLILVLIDHQKIWGVRQVILKNKELDLATLDLETRRSLVFFQAPETALRLWIGESLTSSYNTLEVEKTITEAFLLLGAKALVKSSDRYDAFISSKQSHLATKIFPWVKGWTWASAALLAAFLVYTTIDQISQTRQQQSMAHLIVEQAKTQNIALPSLEETHSLEEWIEETESYIQNKLSPYPLQGDIPSPRDTLGWISDILVSSGNSHITSFEYKSESYPDSKHTNAKYRVKVELEIEVFDPSLAESIQQKFLKAYDWLERPSALVWKAQKDRYQVSFYLKDRTRYVQ